MRKLAGLGRNEALVIAAEGYSPTSPVAQTVAAERYLLETVLRRPVIVKAMSTAGPPDGCEERRGNRAVTFPPPPTT